MCSFLWINKGVNQPILYKIALNSLKNCHFWAVGYDCVYSGWHQWNDCSGMWICCVIVILISNTIVCWAEDSVHSQVVWKLLRKGINNNNVNEHSCYTVLTIDQAVQITIQYLYIFSNKWTNCLLCGVKLHSE